MQRGLLTILALLFVWVTAPKHGLRTTGFSVQVEKYSGVQLLSQQDLIKGHLSNSVAKDLKYFQKPTVDFSPIAQLVKELLFISHFMRSVYYIHLTINAP